MEKYLTLEERLVEHGLLSAEEMERIAKLQHEQRSQLARLVVELGFVSEDDWFDYRLENDPRFLSRIAAARASLRAGHGVRLEDLEEESTANQPAAPDRGHVAVLRKRERSRSGRGG